MASWAPQTLEAASVLDDLSDGFVALDRDWRFTYVNARGAEIQGKPASALVGRRLLEIYPEAAGSAFERAYRQAMSDRVPTHVEAYYPPWDRWFDQHVYPTADGIAVFFVDVTERRRAEELTSGQSRILELIATERPLAETLDALILCIEAAFPGLLGSVLLLDEDGRHVRHGAAPSLPAEYSRLINGQPIGPSAGSCGTAMFRREQVIVEDIEADPLWRDYRDAARAHGLRACWSTPIFDHRREVLGTFALYFRKPARPDGEHARSIEMATHTAAIAILKARADRQREHLMENLAERVKESTLLHQVARLLEGGRAVDELLLRELVALIPRACRYDQRGAARIRFGALEVRSEGWRETPWQLVSQFRTAGGLEGIVEAVYTSLPGHASADPFLPEERELLRSIADMLGAHVERDRARAAVERSEALFRSMFQNAAVGMTMTNMDGRIARCNPALARMLGYTVEELAGRRFADFTHPEDVEPNLSLYRDLVEGRIAHFRLEKRYLRRDGGVIWVDLTVSMPPPQPDGERYSIGMMEDITARKESEKDLQRFRAAMDASGDAILLVDRATLRYVDVNQTFCDLVGYAREELLRMTPVELFSADRGTLERDYDAIIADQDAAASKVEGSYRRKDGSTIPIETRRRALRTPEGWIIVGTARDISERKQAEERIRYLATHDELTGLPNRALMQDRIVQTIAHARRSGRLLAMLYIDLDRFKVINDGFGHPFGDAVLREVGSRLAALVRAGDTVARHGGDEFLVLLSDLRRADDAYLVARKFVESLDRPVEVQGRVVHLSGSVGVSVFPQDGETADALISNADVAMYRAKDLGRNTFQFFTREMSAETQRKVELETRLRGAAAAGQLQLHYQPKVSLESGRITSCEALLRWHHPELGQVSPAQFIPIAEDSGLIVPIGDWALRTACAQNRAWLDAGLPPVTVAVNISARQFLQQDVVEWTLRTLRETGLPPAQLELELTESLIAQDVEKVIATVNELKKAGVKLSIDDFGTGYSSLSYLKRFRVDTLKIDQSFVRNMLTEMDDATIVLAVISLAHNLRFQVIAEGVETAEHCRFLRLNRCDEIQGYHFSKPLPAAEFEALLRAGKRLA